MKRAALYARFSSDLQSDRSIDDQFAVCRSRALRDGLMVVAAFEDRAKSGASVFGRAGLAKMVEAAKRGEFDVLIVEALDRISRDQEDMASIFKRLSFHNVEIVTVHEGKADAIQVGIRGIVSSLFLTDLAHKVRRGHAGNIREGKHAGGLAYGYRHTPGQGGVWVIYEPEAAIIRRIYAEYVAGERTRAIINRLNAEHVPAPRGAYWRQGTLTGSNNRHNGILGNEIYSGRLIWNRVRMIKDPDTGKRISRVNPESEWHRADVPHLAIVEPDVFAKATTIRLERGHTKPAYRREPKHMLSGLLRCASCGGGMAVKGKDSGGVRVACTRHREAGTCDNQRSYYLHAIERAVLGGLREHLRNPEAIKHFLRTYHAERKRLAADAVSAKARLEKELGEVSRKLERAMAAMLASSDAVESYTAVIGALEADKRRLNSELSSLDEPVSVVALHPAAQARYLALVEDVIAALKQGDPSQETVSSIRDLIETVTVQKTLPGQPIVVDVRGKLEGLLETPVFAETASGGKVVARARYGLTPRGSVPSFPFRCRGLPAKSRG